MIAGSLEIQLLANLARLQQDMNQAKSIVGGTMKDIERTVGKMKEIFGAGFVATGLTMIAKQAMGAEQAVNRLNAVITATGNASGYTREQLHGLADEMARATQFEDEDIRDATASLLKFGNIHSDTLKKALKLSADYAAFTGTNMAAASETLGKAISSPAQGIERLQRAIGYLNPAQVEAIKNMQEMGDTAGAQAALMAILEQKIGGVAETMNTGYTKAFGDAKKATGEFFETLGGTAVVTVPVQSFLKFAADSMRDMKHIIEDGDWVQAAKFLMGFRQTDEQAAARNPATGGASDPAKMAAAELEAKRKFDEALAAQDARAIEFQIKQRKAGAEKVLKDRVELAEAALRADEMFAADYAEAWKWADHYRNEEAKKAADEREAIAKAEQDANDMFAKDYAEAWKFANEYVRNEEKKRTEEAEAQWGGFLGGIESAFRQTWDAFGSGAKNAGQVARESLKRILFDWLYQMMLKPFVLNIVASGANAMGLSGLGSLATTAAGGASGIAGMSGLIGSGLTGLGGLIGGGFGSGLTMAGTMGIGQGFMAGAGAFFSGQGMMAGLGAMLPGIGIALGALYLLHQAFGDKGENWKGKLGFGANANAYTSTGPFGAQGFEYIAGDDATNRSLQAFMGSTLGIDRQLAARMTPAQIAAITGRLTGAYSTRNDGQPAEFAFGKDDGTAAQQLTMEFLQKKYGTIFDEIDGEFAKFIRGFTGTSEELLTAIGEFAGLLDMLDATGIKGLNIETLRAFQKEGEELGATFARITQQYATFQDLFYTEAEKIAMVQDQVTSVFADLGIAVPASNEEFRRLVEGLDLSTEAGRKMFTALMGVAPSFNAITNAAAAAVTRFNSLAATLSPSFGATNARGVLEARVRTWMGLSPSHGEAGGWNVENTIENIGRLVREGKLGEALTYAQSLGGNAVTVLNDMLEAYIAWTTAMQNAQTPVTTVGTAISGLGDAAARAAEQMKGAKEGLWAYLQGLFVNPSLSPLDPMAQLGAAKSQFYEQLALARGGDLGAASGLSGFIDTILNLGRGVFASGSGYVDLFNEITRAAADFAKPGGGDELQRNIYAESVVSNDLLRDVKALLIDIRDRGTADGEAITGAVTESALSTARR